MLAIHSVIVLTCSMIIRDLYKIFESSLLFEEALVCPQSVPWMILNCHSILCRSSLSSKYKRPKKRERPKKGQQNETINHVFVVVVTLYT